MNLSDLDLAENWTKDPKRSFDLLYQKYSSLLLRYTFRFTNNQEQAEEILHEVFTEVLKVSHQIDKTWQLKNWLFVLAKNKSLNFLRKKNREVLSEDLSNFIALESCVDQKYFEKQIHSKLQNLPQILSVELLQTWSLREAGLSYKQISSKLNIPIGTVKSRFFRIVEIIKKELDL